jgi:DNA-binding NtrC family response regulator
MVKEFTILISDRNRNIREYLKREFEADGFRVRLAKSAREVLEWIYQNIPIDLVILDPELPGVDNIPLLEKISDRVPILPIVVHSFSPDYCNQTNGSASVHFVEKKGSSIEYLKKEIFRLLNDNSSINGEHIIDQEGRNNNRS